MELTALAKVGAAHARITAEWLNGFDRETLYFRHDAVGIVGSHWLHVFLAA